MVEAALPLQPFQVPANKFSPPLLDESLVVGRQRLCSQTHRLFANKKNLLIVAQAGQGKTTFIQQYLQHYSLPSCWYQLGEEDSDPFFFAQALLFALVELYPNLQHSVSMEMAAHGALSPADLPKLGNGLLHDLAREVKSPLYLVFDDLHLLEEQQLSLHFLTHLITASPSHIRFILASRRPVALPVKAVNKGSNTVSLGNEELALNQGETLCFLQQLINDPVSNQLSKELHSATEGWPMGICAMAFAGLQDGVPLTSREVSREDCFAFLHEEVWRNIPPQQQQPILRLALLEQIPVELANRILQRQDSGELLLGLCKGNLFIRVHGKERQLFSFHHLFADFLDNKAHELLSAEEINDIRHIAALYYQESGEVETALSYLAQVADYQAIDQLLASHGIQIIAANRPLTLARLLKEVPGQVINSHGWLAFFAGLVQIDAAPKQALPLLLTALEHFDKQQDRLGALLACSRIIYGHFIGTGCYNEGRRYLQRAEQLFVDLKDDLPIYHRIFVEMNLAVGFCFFCMDRGLAEKYGQDAALFAKTNSMHNFLAASQFVLASTYHLTGNRYLFANEAEEAYQSIWSPFVGALHKMSLQIIQVSYLQMHGDFGNYYRQRDELISQTSEQVLEQTFARSSFRTWEATIEISLGNFDKAGHLLHLEEASSLAATTGHMRSIFLQWRAYVAALQGDSSQVENWCEQSLQLRREAGGPFYQVLNLVVVGAALARAGRDDKAREILNQAVEQANQLDSTYMQACAYWQRCSFLLEQQDRGASQDLQLLVELLSRHRYGYLWAMTPAQVENLLHFSVQEEVKPELSTLLVPQLVNWAITSSGEKLPVLQVSGLGELVCRCQGEVILRGDDFTPSQRQVMAMLLASPRLSMKQSTLEVTLWPEAEPDKARSNFEVLLMRLRKTINSCLPGPWAKEYLQIKRGVLRLRHSVSDLHSFQSYGEKGLSCFTSKKWWQAENYFFLATSLWQGSFVPEAPGNSLIWSCRDASLQLYIKIVSCWVALLSQRKQLRQAKELVDQALLYDRINPELVSLAYQLRLKSSPAQARKVLENYRLSLANEDFSESEITEMVDGLLSELAGEMH